jgi:MerR family transcriptional regulator, repressor of the yfmOP operon
MRLSSQDLLQISDLAKKLGITARTIRLYEQMGLVDAPKRTEGGIRVYDHEDVKRFKFILKVKELGLSLLEMQELAQLYKEYREPDKIMPRLIELLDFHLAGIRHKVSQLQSLEKDITEYRRRILDMYHLPRE